LAENVRAHVSMRALVFQKPHDVRHENVPDPKIVDPRDAIVRVTSTAICGTDLHISSPHLGHEFMGIVEEVGAGVGDLVKGDRVVVPFPIACGRAETGVVMKDPEEDPKKNPPAKEPPGEKKPSGGDPPPKGPEPGDEPPVVRDPRAPGVPDGVTILT